MMQTIKDILRIPLEKVLQEKTIVPDATPPVVVEKTKEEKFGHFSTNIAMTMASLLKRKPRDIAEIIISAIDKADKRINKIEVAGPGFINFFMSNAFWHSEFKKILLQGKQYGKRKNKEGEKVLIEFVSANPTGPLHIGHGRGAVVGDVLSNILQTAGYDVQKEYYINDRGAQMDTLGKSTWIRYQQIFKKDAVLPDNGYKGKYIVDIAQKIIQEQGDSFIDKTEEEALPFFREYSQETITEWIKKDLCDFGVEFDTWFSEKALFETKKVDSAINRLREKNYLYEKDGALWMKTADGGDEKDRVLIRANGEHTYFAADIAYHTDKFVRGFKRIIDIWGADHHGYVPRMNAVLSHMGYNNDAFTVLLVQMVNLKRGGKQISMSTRGGEFVPLSEVIKEVGKDVARFFFLMRSSNSHLDFDMELAKKESKENPVYYIQYAHARIQSILTLAEESRIPLPAHDQTDMSLLTLPEEIQLMKQAAGYPDMLENSAMLLEPHLITYYLQTLAACFHSYYNKHKVISPDRNITNARLILILGIQTIIRNAFRVLGITPLDKM